jgi:hypothetical protein
VFFHGSVPGPQRKALVDRFRDDPACRVFLATDAGGVGLNLQHASVVFNMDLPWNPAVLEQRIGRVHRLGQQSAVQVVNFVARGTIEEGMLNLLKFKTSLFRGILDGGDKNVSLGGSRLKRFMESVETATTNIPAAPPQEEPQPSEDEKTRELVAPPVAVDPWAGLMQAGAALLQQLATPPANGGSPLSGFVRRDEQTGEQYLRLPVPPPGFVEAALGMVQQLLAGFRPPANGQG